MTKSNQQIVWEATPERDLQETVRQIAERNHWFFYHPWQSVHSPSGFPDCTMVRGDRLILAELKAERGTTTDAQQAWLEAFRACGKCEVYIWRPSDRDEIEEVLR